MKTFFKAFLSIIVIAVGIFIFRYLMTHKIKPKKIHVKYPGPIVEVVNVKRGDFNVILNEFGTIRPYRKVNIIPQVSGKIIYISDNFYIGKFVKKGEILVKLEKIDYFVALKKAIDLLKQAELNYEIIKEKAKISKREWQLSKREFPLKNPSKLKLYIPQLAEAKAKLEFAKANVLLAKKNLERTVIRAPFDAVVTYKNCDIGEFEPAGKILGVLIYTKKAEVHVKLPDYEMKWLDFSNKDVKILLNLHGEKFYFNGILSRISPQMDVSTRTFDLIIDILEPYSTKPPLLIGSFVEAKINGAKLRNVIKLPNSAIHDDNEVWLFRAGKLKIERVKILKRNENFSYVRGNIKDNELAIITHLSYVSDGMRVMLKDEMDN